MFVNEGEDARGQKESIMKMLLKYLECAKLHTQNFSINLFNAHSSLMKSLRN